MNPANGEYAEHHVGLRPVKNGFPNIPLRLMVVRPESMKKAPAVGIPSQWVLLVNEIKRSFFWHSCRCVGWNTLLPNLLITIEPDEIPVAWKKGWKADYAGGLDYEIYEIYEFLGKNFTELVKSVLDDSNSPPVHRKAARRRRDSKSPLPPPGGGDDLVARAAPTHKRSDADFSSATP